jgi:AcrR family transcriptional regulator
VAPVRLRADAQRNRRLLLDAAAAAFADGGIEASVAEIVERAGVAKGTFFRHFPTKEELVVALLVDRLAEITAIAREVNAGQDVGWEAVRAFVERSAERTATDRSFLDAAVGVDREDSAVRDIRAELAAEVGTLLERAQATGEVRSDIAASDIPMILMAVTHATAPLHAQHPTLFRRYLRLFLDGLRPHAGAGELPASPLPFRAVAAARRPARRT